MMKILTKYKGRKVYFYKGQLSHVSSVNLKLPDPHFICTFFFHDTHWNDNDLTKLLDLLIKNGCVYFLFHGRSCKEAHGLADEVAIKFNPSATEDNVIMTTWHERQSIEDVIFATFCVAWPVKDYEDSFSSYVIFSFGSDEENDNVQYLLNNLQATIKG